MIAGHARRPASSKGAAVKKNVATVLALTAGTMVVAACGSSGTSSAADNGESAKSATQIVQDTAAAYRSATSVHLAGSVKNSGQTISLDIKIVRDGNLSGTITFQGVTANVVIVGGKTYIKGKELFAQFAGGAAAAAIGDNWVAVPATAATQITGGFSSFTNFSKLADQLTTPTGAVTKGATTTVVGQSVITVSDTKSTLYVATTGKPYPVQLKPDNDPTQHLDFTDYDQTFVITAPSGALDYSGFGSDSTSSSTSP
jgi:hypothetical protein